MNVSELAGRAGVAPSAVRWYEAAGVLPRASRRPNGYRDYDDDDLTRLRLVRGAAPPRRGARRRGPAGGAVPGARLGGPRSRAAHQRAARRDRAPARRPRPPGCRAHRSRDHDRRRGSTRRAKGRQLPCPIADPGPVRLHGQLGPQPDRGGPAPAIRRGRLRGLLRRDGAEGREPLHGARAVRGRDRLVGRPRQVRARVPRRALRLRHHRLRPRTADLSRSSPATTTRSTGASTIPPRWMAPTPNGWPPSVARRWR